MSFVLLLICYFLSPSAESNTGGRGASDSTAGGSNESKPFTGVGDQWSAACW